MASLFPFFFSPESPSPSPQFPFSEFSVFQKTLHSSFCWCRPFKNQDVPWKWTSRLKWQYWVWLSERDFLIGRTETIFSLLLCQAGLGPRCGGLAWHEVGLRLPPAHPTPGLHLAPAPQGTSNMSLVKTATATARHGQGSCCTPVVKRLPSLNSQKKPPKQLVFTHVVGTVTIITTTFSGNVTLFYLTAWANLYSEK